MAVHEGCNGLRVALFAESMRWMMRKPAHRVRNVQVATSMKNTSPRPREVFRREVLTGWKDIATYLGRGVRTVQRYERAFSLPVRRPSGKSAGSVLAKKAELDAWTAGVPLREGCRLSPGSVDKKAVDTRLALTELNRQVEELHRLHEEGAELRTALHESVELLRKSIRFSLTQEFSSLERRVRADILSFLQKRSKDSDMDG
jgi:hypothetical protein